MTRRLLMAWLVVWKLQAMAVEPALPAWEEADRAAVKAGKWVPGSLLLTDESPADEPAVEKQGLLPAPTDDEWIVDQTPLTQISESFLGAYFNGRPESLLIDPQKLLSPQQYRDRLSFLDYHATDSSIDLVVYVFGMHQEIPGEVRAEELAERLYSTGRQAAVVFYFLGAPQRSVLYLSPSLTDTVSDSDQKRALQNSVIKSLEKTDPVDQLEAFSLQMSIRLYWMERMLAGTVTPEGIVTRSEKTSGKPSQPGAKERLDKLIPSAWRLPLGLSMGAIVAASLVIAWLRQRIRYRFPEFEIEPRLGGDRGAGIGAVISFAKSSLPPAQQREQLPDDLRRS